MNKLTNNFKNLKLRDIKKTLLIISIALLSAISSLTAQNLTVPDVNFKAYLVGNLAINTNADAEIQLSEAFSFSGQIACSGLGIADLNGIGAFTGLTSLSCGNNSLTTLVLANNPLLTFISCYENQLTSLNLSMNTALVNLNCEGNPITSLDLTTNTSLTDLNCSSCAITSLNTTSNISLVNLYCSYNPIINLNVSGNVALNYLDCSFGQLSSLGISTNVNLTNLYCSSNQITSLDPSNNTALTILWCDNNLLTLMDVVANTAVVSTRFNNNQLEFLNIQNGNNSNLTTFMAANNPNLTCIQVDDASYMNTNWSGFIDATAAYDIDCGLGLLNSTINEVISIYPNPTSSKLTITTSTPTTLSIYNVIGEELMSFEVNSSKTLDISTFQSGIYFVKTINGDLIKFIKE